MITAAVLSAIFTAVASILLAAVVKVLSNMRGDVQRFMAEHLWLLASAQWTQKTVGELMEQLGMHADPPPEWPGKK